MTTYTPPDTDDTSPSQFTYVNRKINAKIDKNTHCPIRLSKILEILNITGEFNQPIDNLPCSITVLQLGKKFNQPINNFILNKKKNEKYFDSTLEIELGSDFNQPIKNDFNIPLEILFIDNWKYNEIPNVNIEVAESFY